LAYEVVLVGLGVLFFLAFGNGANDVGKSVVSLMIDPETAGFRQSYKALLWGGVFSGIPLTDGGIVVVPEARAGEGPDEETALGVGVCGTGDRAEGEYNQRGKKPAGHEGPPSLRSASALLGTGRFPPVTT